MTRAEFNIQKALGLIKPSCIFIKCTHCKISGICEMVDGHLHESTLYKITRIPLFKYYVNGCYCYNCDEYLIVKYKRYNDCKRT